MKNRLTIIVDEEEVSDECLRNYAGWMLENGWLAVAEKIKINKEVFFNMDKDYEQWNKFMMMRRNKDVQKP